MAGIGGIVCFDTEKSPQALAEAALWMQRALPHGAGRRALWQQGRAALLYAGPVDGGRDAQPVRLLCGAREWVGLYDGEERARTALEGFAEWGEDWLCALGDAFALAAWDAQGETLTLARGAAGAELWCARIRGGLAFAGDPSALRCLYGWTQIAPPEPMPAGHAVRAGRDSGGNMRIVHIAPSESP